MLGVSPPLHWVVSGIIDDCKGGHTFSQSKSSYKRVESFLHQQTLVGM